MPGKLVLLLTVALGAFSQLQPDPAYVLGPDDQVVIRVLDVDEIGAAPYRIDLRGNLNVPLVGRLRAAGLTVEQLESELALRLKKYLLDPTVTVAVAEFRSLPVSVLGAVGSSGVHQIRGTKTLFEVLSMAGGLKPEAGNVIKITRRKSSGPIPLPTSALDPSGEFYVAEVKVKSIMEAKNPQENIPILPNDIISVPKGDLVYVIGSVRRPGGFVLNEKENISILQVISMAEGLDRSAAPSRAKILRPGATESANRTEIPVDLKKILASRSPDVQLLPNDILFVPINGPKNAVMRGVEVAIGIGSGWAIYRR
jgi:polysaccharide export outer membrane protein